MGQTDLNDRFPWYEIVQGRELEQGDLISQCPIVRIEHRVDWSAFTQGSRLEIDTQLQVGTGIVLTQSCDLAIREDGGRHARDVVFCAVYTKPELANNPQFGSPRSWEEARKGRRPAYHVLNHCELPGHERDYMLADFTRIFTVPIDVLDPLVKASGSRLRLNPPYREHLSQAFARFFMRVGLPVDIPRFS